MAVPLLSKKIVKKRVKKFKRPQSDRKISVKVYILNIYECEVFSHLTCLVSIYLLIWGEKKNLSFVLSYGF